MNNKGQSILSEYVMIFFVVIAAAVAVTTYVQRSFEARVHDARNYMIDAVNKSSVCDANCMAATGGSISHEYEPYYSEMVSDAVQNESDSTGAGAGNRQVLGAKYFKNLNEETQTTSTSVQLPPGCTDAATCAKLMGG
jgi:hypothetical protein